MRWQWLWPVLLVGALSGCVTVQDSKSLVIFPEPGETAIAVTSIARAHCLDFLFLRCELHMELQRTPRAR